MKYKMTVTIFDPKTPEGMSSDIVLILHCTVSHNPDDYGNGCYVAITNGEDFQNLYDVRYDQTFHRADARKWFEDWAHSYWSGENGAYAVKRLAITEE